MKPILQHISVFCLLIPAFLELNAQETIHSQYQVDWKEQAYRISDSTYQSFLIPMEFAYQLDQHFLPTIVVVEALDVFLDMETIQIDSITWLPFNQFFYNLPENLPSLDPADELSFQVWQSGATPYLEISFPAWRINPENDELEMISSFVLSKHRREKTRSLEFAHTFKTSSVLKDSKWVKVGVEQDGIYHISAQELQAMGFDSPSSIKVFGNYGGLLPLMNIETNQDDLVEMAISREVGGITFFAKGPNRWVFDEFISRYKHRIHLYSNLQYYFLTDGVGEGKSIDTENFNSQNFDTIITSYDDYYHYEPNDTNFVKSGRQWYGDEFYVRLDRSYSFDASNLIQSEPIDFELKVLAHSTVPSRFVFHPTGDTLTIPSVLLGTEVNFANEISKSGSFSLNQSNSNLKLEFLKSNSSSKGWIDYLSLNFKRSLTFSKPQVIFRSRETFEEGLLFQFRANVVQSNYEVWDVSDLLNVKRLSTISEGGSIRFVVPGKNNQEFVAFQPQSGMSVFTISEIANQNIHSSATPDLTIVFPEFFREQAEELAEIHRNEDGMHVLAVSDQEVYHEFSAGVPDISAIRNMMKMFYNRGQISQHYPRYLLFFGDASYNNKPDFAERERHLLSYQNLNSLHPISSVGTDDFFGFLDDNEGDFFGKLDLGIGRIPVSSSNQANAALDKIKKYYFDSFGNWRNLVSLIADDPDHPTNNSHMNQAESIAAVIENRQPGINVEKIYLDAFPRVSTASGDRYPAANEAVNRKVNLGSLIVNYTGHGNEIGLSHERVITVEDISNWTNYDHLSLFVTATCEFSRFDDHNRVSGGEFVFRNEKGGGIALITTSRSVYYNSALNLAIYNNGLQKEGDDYLRLGDIIRRAKNESSSASEVNIKKYYLLGNPAMRLAFPKYFVTVDSINSVAVELFLDTLGALSLVKMGGFIRDNFGNVMDDFNGILESSIFDKVQQEFTLGNIGNEPHPYQIQNRIIYKGRASVRDGYYEFEFLIPKDISYRPGNGKISLYASNNEVDAAGFDDNLQVGGTNPNFIPDDLGPEIRPFMNDTNFIDGGITDENPKLLLHLFDESGINTVGNGIGHDVVAILDNKQSELINLNDFYQADLDTYKSGSISYSLKNLSPGLHEIWVRVWDNHNNSSEATLQFVVKNGEQIEMGKVNNYPNPFSDRTFFYFEHNQGNGEAAAMIEIFNITGQLIKSIQIPSLDAYRTGPIEWDGRNSSGSLLPAGIYYYQLSILRQSLKTKHAGNKLVILR